MKLKGKKTSKRRLTARDLRRPGFLASQLLHDATALRSMLLGGPILRSRVTVICVLALGYPERSRMTAHSVDFDGQLRSMMLADM